MAGNLIEEISILGIGAVVLVLLYQLGAFDAIGQQAVQAAADGYDYLDQNTDPVNLATAAGVIDVNDNQTVDAALGAIPSQVYSDPWAWGQSHQIF